MYKSGPVGQRAKKSKAPQAADKKIHAIKHARRGITAVTSSFSDGSRGPIAFCVPEGRVTADEMKAFNLANVGEAFLFTSGSTSHFMTADTLHQVFEQLFSPAIERQRER